MILLSTFTFSPNNLSIFSWNMSIYKTCEPRPLEPYQCRIYPDSYTIHDSNVTAAHINESFFMGKKNFCWKKIETHVFLPSLWFGYQIPKEFLQSDDSIMFLRMMVFFLKSFVTSKWKVPGMLWIYRNWLSTILMMQTNYHMAKTNQF